MVVFGLPPQSLFAHELGHSLGMEVHDNEFYTHDPGHKLIMWSDVGDHAYIWSPEAKRKINQHDTSCLATVAEQAQQPHCSWCWWCRGCG